MEGRCWPGRRPTGDRRRQFHRAGVRLPQPGCWVRVHQTARVPSAAREPARYWCRGSHRCDRGHRDRRVHAEAERTSRCVQAPRPRRDLLLAAISMKPTTDPVLPVSQHERAAEQGPGSRSQRTISGHAVLGQLALARAGRSGSAPLAIPQTKRDPCPRWVWAWLVCHGGRCMGRLLGRGVE